MTEGEGVGPWPIEERLLEGGRGVHQEAANGQGPLGVREEPVTGPE